MSRSKKKYPYGWLCSNSSAMKKWKNQNDRSIRRLNVEIPSGNHYKKMKDIWVSPSDGKADFTNWHLWTDKKWKIFAK